MYTYNYIARMHSYLSGIQNGLACIHNNHIYLLSLGTSSSGVVRFNCAHSSRPLTVFLIWLLDISLISINKLKTTEQFMIYATQLYTAVCPGALIVNQGWNSKHIKKTKSGPEECTQSPLPRKQLFCSFPPNRLHLDTGAQHSVAAGFATNCNF